MWRNQKVQVLKTLYLKMTGKEVWPPNLLGKMLLECANMFMILSDTLQWLQASTMPPDVPIEAHGPCCTCSSFDVSADEPARIAHHNLNLQCMWMKNQFGWRLSQIHCTTNPVFPIYIECPILYRMQRVNPKSWWSRTIFPLIWFCNLCS